MKTFQYKGFDRDGKPVKGMIEALGIKEARAKLASSGILADKVYRTTRKLKLNAEARSMLYRELSVLLDGGLTVEKALDILATSPDMKSYNVIIAGVRDGIREGLPLARAVNEAASSLSPFETAVIEAAERSATVPLMLDRLADFIEEQERLREKIQGALVYPLIVVTVGICVAAVMLGVLVPRAAVIFGKSELPAVTEFTMALGKWLTMWGGVLLAGMAVAFAWVRVKAGHDARFRERWNKWLFSTPVFGRSYRILVNLRFARTFAVLLQGGVPVIEGFGLSARATGNRWISEMAERQAEEVRHGTSLSDAVAGIPPLAVSLPAWIRSGEASGGLAKLLESAGARFQREWERYTGRCISVIEPCLILVVGAFVLLVTVSVLLPILSLTRTLGG